MVYSGRNENEQAIKWLAKAYEERSGSVVFMSFDPFVENLRPDPRFQGEQSCRISWTDGGPAHISESSIFFSATPPLLRV